MGLRNLRFEPGGKRLHLSHPYMAPSKTASYLFVLEHFPPFGTAMKADQYTELISFLSGKFGRIDQRFDALEGRVIRVEIGLEALRHDVQLLSEGSTATNERLDRYHQDHEVRIKALEVHWFEA